MPTVIVNPTGPSVVVNPVGPSVLITSGNAPAAPATPTTFGSVMLAGDLGGTASVPIVEKIQGTTIQSPPGVNTKFLAGDGSWQNASAGSGVQIGGDIGGTNTVPLVTSTHLGSPLPIAQGGTGSATQNFITLGGDVGGTVTSPQVTSTHLSSALPINQGGTGQGTQAAALTALAGAQSAGTYLRSDGTNTTLSGIQAGDVPTLNQSTTGTASNVTGTVTVAHGGTGQTTQQAALNTLAGAVTSGRYLRGDGTNVTLAAIQAADVPTLNQSTTGTSSNVTGTVAIANGGTGQTTASGAFNALSPNTTLGDIIYASGANANTRLPGNTTATRNFLRQTGTGSLSAAPAWDTIQASDVPTLNQSTTGTASNVTGTVALANGGTGQTSAAAAYNALSPMTTLGDLEYESGANTASRLAGNTSATKQFLTQTGNGSVSAAPAWGTIAAGDVPTLNQNTTGTAGNVTGTVALGNGGTGATTAVNARAGLGVYEADIPSQRGWIEWNYPPLYSVAVSQNFTSGTVYGVSLVCQTNASISKVGVQVVSSASTPTAGQNLIGFYTISGTTATQQTVTGDLGTWGSNGFNSYSFGASQTLVAGSTIMLLFLSVAGTAVHLQGTTSDTAAQIGFLNLGLSLSASPWTKFFVFGTAQTTLPASFTISSATVTNALAPWTCML